MSSITSASDEDVLYPSSDGEPVGETDWHIWALILLRQALEDFFAARADVKVASDMFLYYRRGDPSACKAPDMMVIKGVGKHLRRSFKTWIENALPCVIIEIASEKTWEEDLSEKRELYERLGVREYFVFDPEACYLDLPLQGFRLRGKRYASLKAAADSSLTSKELGLDLLVEGPMLRLRDAQTGQPILTRQERAEQAQRQVEQEHAEMEQERQRAELERAEKEQERQRAEQERAEKERQRQRADALEAELLQLRAEQAKRKSKKKER